MELYLRVRRACKLDGMSIREASRVFGLHRDTVRKMLEYSVPPGYRRRQAPRRLKIRPYTGVIDRILEDDLCPPGWRLLHSIGSGPDSRQLPQGESNWHCRRYARSKTRPVMASLFYQGDR